jgi:hypothetical protein
MLITTIHQNEYVGTIAYHVFENLSILDLLDIWHNLLISVIERLEFFYLSFGHPKIDSGLNTVMPTPSHPME